MASSGDAGARPKEYSLRSRSLIDYRKMNEGKLYALSPENSEEELNYEDYEESVDSSVDFHECENGSEPEPEAVPNSSLTSQEAKIRSMKAELEKLKEEEKLLRLRNEEDELRREMVERRKNVNKLRGNSPPNIARDKQSKHMELSDKSLNIDKLRGNKQLRKLVKKELFSIGLVNSGDSASAEASNIESEAEQKTTASEGLGSLSRKSKTKKKIVKNKKNVDKDSGSSSQYSFSDSSSGSISISKKGKKKVKSGIHAKSSDSVRNRQRYPQAHLRFEFAGSDLTFEKLDLNLFVAGELEIIGDVRTEKVERSGRLSLLKKLMYLSTAYDLTTLKAYYAGVLRDIEVGAKTWKDDFQYVETAILAKHTPRNKQSFGNSLKKKYQKSTNLTNKKQGQDSSGHEEKIWFCAAYQRNKCAHKSTHTLIVKGRMRMAQHICASCWQKDSKKLEHPECSSTCPHSVN